MTLVEHWREALAGVVVRFPDPAREVLVEVTDDAICRVWFASARCAVTGKELPGFCVSNVHLDVWPGERLARMWIAAAWCGYLQHEALEMVVDRGSGERVLDPHADPYDSNPYNRGVRDGFPVRLTRGTLVTALAVAMPPQLANDMVYALWGI